MELSVLDKFPLRIRIHSSDAQGAISELVECYSDSIGLSTEIRNEIKRKVMAREGLGASMLDNGVVIPHARIKDLLHSAIVVGYPRRPIVYDGRKVALFFLVLSPEKRPNEHVMLLCNIARLCSSPDFLQDIPDYGFYDLL